MSTSAASFIAGLIVALAGTGHGLERTDEAARSADFDPLHRADQPRLVLVIVLDQFPYDYLRRFRSHFGAGGFELLLERGAVLTSGRYEHATTRTCPGHAVILSGTHADINGIISNQWFSAAEDSVVSCVTDAAFHLIGAEGYGRSPQRFLGSTVGDALKRATNGRARVVSMSFKDTSAIMMGGRLADEAYWVEDSLFVTSAYYMDRLPDWVRGFNGAARFSSHFGSTWDRLLPAEAYALQGPDDAPGEDGGDGLGRVFPHPVDGGSSTMSSAFLDAFGKTPFANEVLEAFAEEVIVNEGLGQDEITDLLAVSFSANDKAGHAYGPDSHEVMDLTVRTDRLLARLFAFLEDRVGLESTVIVLTADHGIAPLPEALRRLHSEVHTGRIHPDRLREAAEAALVEAYGSAPGSRSWLRAYVEHHFYLDHSLLAERDIPREAAARVLALALSRLEGIHEAFTHADLVRAAVRGEPGIQALLSFHPHRSGDVFVHFDPFWFEYDEIYGTTHGSPWEYDARVPIILFGPGVRPGFYREKSSVAQIAPTLAALLDVDVPTGSQRAALNAVLE
ncbi:MAG TPA: alkaline phosphatase family protein [Gemmatimonadota bacterium]|nr:alkaline phosphatase family protein [Gemmatimonadota bacterium]